MSGRAKTYLALTIVGGLVPLILLGIFVGREGFDLAEAGDQIFGDIVAAAVMADLAISSLVFWVWLFREARRVDLSPWPFVLANIFVALSFALPLFLYVRERRAAAAPTIA